MPNWRMADAQLLMSSFVHLEPTMKRVNFAWEEAILILDETKTAANIESQKCSSVRTKAKRMASVSLGQPLVTSVLMYPPCYTASLIEEVIIDRQRMPLSGQLSQKTWLMGWRGDYVIKYKSIKRRDRSIRFVRSAEACKHMNISRSTDGLHAAAAQWGCEGLMASSMMRCMYIM